MIALQWTAIGLAAWAFAMGSDASEGESIASGFCKREHGVLTVRLPILDEEEVAPIIADLLGALAGFHEEEKVMLHRSYYKDLYQGDRVETVERYKLVGRMKLRLFRERIQTYMKILSRIRKAIGIHRGERGLDEELVSDFIAELFASGSLFSEYEFDIAILKQDSRDLQDENIVALYARKFPDT